MAMYKCDFPGCEKYFTSQARLKKHKARVHGATPGDAPPAPATTHSDTAHPGLTIKKPTTGDAPGYHCDGCGTAVKKGQENCPGCGESLVWGGIE